MIVGDMVRRWLLMSCALALSACSSSAAQAVAAAQKTYSLPCAPQTIAASADGQSVWLACRTGAKWDQYQRELAAANAAGKEGPGYGANAFQDAVHVFDLGSAKATKVGEWMAPVGIHPAPKGSLAVITFPQDRGHDRAALYDRATRVGDLQIDPNFLLWSPDATRLYFYGGTTVQADAWNLLGVYQLATRQSTNSRLQKPAENVYSCAGSGHLFAGDPHFDNGRITAPALEYDADAKPIATPPKFPAGHLSAHCRYVATEDDFHGPLPWEVFDTAGGPRLLRVEFSGEPRKGEYEFHGWNPQRESVLLRFQYLPDGRAQVEAFDVASKRIVLTSTEKGPFAWSSDGSAVLAGRGNTLVALPIER